MRKIKIAVCYSGKTRGLEECLHHNEKFFKTLCEKNPFEYHNYCHFWDHEKPYPYDMSLDLIKKINVLSYDSYESYERTISILKPVKTKTSNYNALIDMFRNDFLSRNINYKMKVMYDSLVGKYIEDKDVDIYQFVELNDEINTFVINLSQFYGFENVVSLVETQVANGKVICQFDIIIRLRYDTFIPMSSLDSVVNSIYTALETNSIICNSFNSYEFFYPAGKKNLERKVTYHNNTSNLELNTISEFQDCYGMNDISFLSTTTTMYYFATNMTNNVSKTISWFDKEKKMLEFGAEYSWAKEANSKKIKVISQDNCIYGSIIVRNNEQLALLNTMIENNEPLNYDPVYWYTLRQPNIIKSLD